MHNHQSRWVPEAGLPSVLGGLAWAVAAAGWMYPSASDAALIGAAVGAFLGAIAADNLQQSQRIDCSRLLLIPLVVLAVTGTIVIAWISWWPFGLFTKTVSGILILEETVGCTLTAMAAVGLLRFLCLQKRWLTIVEATFAVWAFSYIAGQHRATLHRPYWLTDWLVECGYSLHQGVWALGLIGAFIWTLILLSRSPSATGWRVRLVQPLVVFCLLGGAFWMASQLFRPPQPILTTAPEVPPPSKSSDSSPPPPPPSQPLAKVEFVRFCPPPERLNGYYLRTRICSTLKGFDLLPDPAPAVAWESLGAYTQEGILTATTNSALEGKAEQLSEVVISHLDTPDCPLALIAPVSFKPELPKYKGVTKAYSVTCAALGKELQDLDPFENYSLLRMSRLSLVNNTWTPLQREAYVQIPDDPRLRSLAQELLKSCDEFEAALPLRRLKAVMQCINKDYAYSERTGGTNSVEVFLFANRIGGGKQFAVATALLLRALKVPARVSEGYRVPVAREDAKPEFVIYDKHATIWPEIYLQGTGWIPVPPTPTNILDRAQAAAPDLEQEKDLFSPVEQAKSVPPARLFNAVSRSQSLRIAALLVCLVLIGPAFWRRILTPVVCLPKNRPARVFRAAIDLAALAGFRRAYGETRSEFAKRVRSQAVWGDVFAALSNAYMANRAGDGALQGPWLMTLWDLEARITKCCLGWPGKPSVSALLWGRLNPFCWYGADRPARAASFRILDVSHDRVCEMQGENHERKY